MRGMRLLAAAGPACLLAGFAASAAAAGPTARPVGFAMCAVCHKVDKGAPNGIGPNLYGVGGARAGASPTYAYSPAMKRSGIVWDRKSLIAFVTAPQKVVPGTKMTYAGAKDRKTAEEVADYLLSLK